MEIYGIRSPWAMPYTPIDHTADIGMRVRADTIEGLFEEATYALADILGGRSAEGEVEIIVETEGVDRIDLLVRWLQEILYIIEVKSFRLKSVSIRKLSETEVLGAVHGVYSESPLITEIKAVTYHNLDITCVEGNFSATIILDM